MSNARGELSATHRPARPKWPPKITSTSARERSGQSARENAPTAKLRQGYCPDLNKSENPFAPDTFESVASCRIASTDFTSELWM